ncbi:LOW QUALITY PROTEIN: hypothetical protein QC762_106270 [Podospora pseudocomata]|uniref:Uncharacterized protein n=1 Tax=Podospora pseudocomata TaxID=2093779 RepID=A0ABR0GT95_9PEZI|nr:LOW QUALITY PROTEIN: hypothetical protein QC762_106270 [Podospora pseudocomata]
MANNKYLDSPVSMPSSFGILKPARRAFFFSFTSKNLKMVSISTLLISAITAVSVSAQAPAEAQDTITRVYNYWTDALELRREVGQVNDLSCLLYTLFGTGPLAKVIPILDRVTANFLETSRAVVTLEPLNATIPAEEEAGKEIDSYVAKGTIEITGAFSRLSTASTVNPCTIPGLGSATLTALRNLKVESQPFYYEVRNYVPARAVEIERNLVLFMNSIDAVIAEFGSVIDT